MSIRLGKGSEIGNEKSLVNDEIAEPQYDELTEAKKLRTANSKIFVLPNGNYRKIVYAKNVHYYNEEEETYRSIDNRLVPVVNETYNEVVGYENRYNSFKVCLAYKLDCGKLMSISKEKYNISWELIDRSVKDAATQIKLNSVGQIRKVNRFSVAQVKETKEKRAAVQETEPRNLNGEVLYEDAFDKADLQYELHSSSIKENIIIKEKSESYVFAFKIHTKNLTVGLSGDSQKIVFCSDAGEEKFRIPMPVMQDAAGIVSSSIYYDIDESADGENIYIFRIIADAAWINAPERILPVTLDPMIEVGDRAYTINYSYENNGTSNFSGVGVNSDSVKGINRLFIRFDEPDFGKDVIVKSVKLNVGMTGTVPEGFKGLIAHRLSSALDFSNLSFNTAYESTALDMVQFIPDKIASIDLTEYFENVIYKGKYTEQVSDFANNGIVIKAVNETSATNNLIQLNNDFNLIFEYRVNSGMQKNQAYSTNEAGRSGMSQVNIRTGSLSFVHESISAAGNRFPINITNVYNSYAANGGYNMNGVADTTFPNICTNGWKLNYQQYLIPETYEYGRGGYVQRYRYIDGDGTTHYLENKGKSGYDVVFADEDGIGLSLMRQNIYSLPYEDTVYDSQNNQLYFDNFRLVKIIKRNGDTTTIEFRNNNDINAQEFYQISKIIFADNKTATFTYNSYNLLTNITCNGTMIKYAYNYYKQLSSITYPDGKTTRFTYTANGALATVTDVSGKKISYTYKSGQPFMVSEISESSAYTSIDNSSVKTGSMTGKRLSIEYVSKNLIRTTNEKEVVTIHCFDAAGNATAVFENKDDITDTLTPVSDFKYLGGDPARKVFCKVPISGMNLATNSSCEIGANATNETLLAFINASQLTVGKTYVVSGLAKANSATIDEEDLSGQNRTFELTVKVYFSGSNNESYHAEYDSKNTSWQMAATAFTVKEGTTGVYVFASYKNNINSARFGNVQITEGRAAIIERKICKSEDPGEYFDAEDIYKVSYKLKPKSENGIEASGALQGRTIHLSDVTGMLQELSVSEVITVRANKSKILVSGAYDVTLRLRNGNEYALADLEIKSITTSETGTIERQKNTRKRFDTAKYCYKSETGGYQIFTVSEISAITYYDAGGQQKTKSRSVLTYKDITNVIHFAKTGQRYISYNDGTAQESTNGTSTIRLVTAYGTYRAADVTETYYTENTNIITDGSDYYSNERYDEFGRKIRTKDIRGLVTEYSYDNYDNVIMTKTYPGANAEPLRKITSNSYTDGNFLSAETDARGISAFSGYSEKGLPEYTETPEGQRTTYSYNTVNDLTGIESSVTNESGSTINRNSFAYNADYLTQVSHNGLNYNFTYSGLGEITEISVAGKPMIRTCVERNATGDVETSVELNESGYATNSTVVYKDRYDRVVQVKRNGESFVENEYNCDNSNASDYSSAKLTRVIDKSAGVAYNYDYDIDGDVKSITYSGARAGRITVEKDNLKRVTGQTHTYGNTTEKAEYTYNYDDKPDERITSIVLDGKFSQNISYDEFSRVSCVTLESNGGFRLSELYNYYIPNKSNLITDYAEIKHYTIGTTSSISESERYSYDNNGNITLMETVRGNIQYEYDGLNRIVQEINHLTNKKYNYTYDAGGNILTKKVTNLYSQAVEQQLNYTYDTTFKDRLISFGNETISGYDLQGRPTLYRGWNLSWKNGRVSSFTKNGLTHSCEYDANGIRIKKVANGLSHEYYLEGNKIVREVVTGTTAYELWYMYGANGIVGFTYKKNGTSTNYYYRKNLLGDIIAIYGENCTKYAEYAYDAWGNCTILQDTNGIGTLNPYRYRGYYFDTELNFYYLNARYYDPQVGRFISQDDISYLDPETLNGLNLFAYCLNNPVMDIDPDGTMPNWLKWVIGAAVIIGLGIASVATGGAAAGVAGFILAGAFKGAVIGAISGALVSGTIGGISSAVAGDGFWKGFADGAADGFMSGAIIGGVTGAISSGVQVANAARSWASTGGKSGFKQMISHYNKHVIKEGQKSVAKNIVNYTKQARSFFVQNKTSGYLLRDGVIKIAGAPGGIFNTNGLIRSFWYIL